MKKAARQKKQKEIGALSWLVLAAAAILLAAIVFGQNRPAEQREVVQELPVDIEVIEVRSTINQSRIDAIAQNIRSGGPPKDGIPPIDNPQYVSAQEANTFLKDTDIVFGINYKNTTKAYPQKILVWHEIVNDEFGERASVTYCPLTGSAIGFRGRVDGRETTFGTSGMLANSCLVMYDRATDSYWPQLLGVAVTGAQKGKKLEQFPVVWTTWGRWKSVFPNTQVLSTTTGFIRPYGTDPYGSYERNDTYYQRGGPFFPVMAESARFEAKEVFIGIEDGRNALAVKKSSVRGAKVINTKLSGEDIVIIYDEALDDALAYRSGGHTFKYENGKVTDERGVVWNIWGESDKERLVYVNTVNAMWYAWYAFYPS